MENFWNLINLFKRCVRRPSVIMGEDLTFDELSDFAEWLDSIASMYHMSAVHDKYDIFIYQVRAYNKAMERIDDDELNDPETRWIDDEFSYLKSKVADMLEEFTNRPFFSELYAN